MENIIDEIKITYIRTSSHKVIKIFDSEQAYEYYIKSWDLQSIELFEEFKILLLNQASEVLGIYTVSKGGISSTVVEIRHIIFIALKTNSTGIIVAHNHPSGNLKPSSNDLKITEKINEACKIMDLNLIDHLILSKESYFSFKDQGYL
ncbi:MAG: JAB domain-containing protein [Candidatus Delongbacteria bacterium]|nr:JAB domain-containing protein [Candidatus Delongbacteria bacterium]